MDGQERAASISGPDVHKKSSTGARAIPLVLWARNNFVMIANGSARLIAHRRLRVQGQRAHCPPNLHCLIKIAPRSKTVNAGNLSLILSRDTHESIKIPALDCALNDNCPKRAATINERSNIRCGCVDRRDCDDRSRKLDKSAFPIFETAQGHAFTRLGALGMPKKMGEHCRIFPMHSTRE
jgi:hypothetical protein